MVKGWEEMVEKGWKVVEGWEVVEGWKMVKLERPAPPVQERERHQQEEQC
jgi:hypothetical protein